MRTLIILIAVLGSGTSLAQGIFGRLHAAAGGELVILAEATNAFRVPFIEVDRDVPNIECVMRLGILEEEVNYYVVLTPSGVHVVEQDGEDVTYSTPDWEDTVFTRASSRVNKLTLTGDGEGARLVPVPPSTTRKYVLGPSSYSSSPTYSCSSSTSSTGSSMTCRTNGRISYTINCTVNPRTYAVNCNSRTY